MHQKAKEIPSIREFNIIMNSISHTNKIAHLFIVAIKFHFKDEKTLLLNKLYTPIFEKSKFIKPYERSMLELLSGLSRNEEKDIINTFKHIAKNLVTRAGWLVTKIYKHYTFEQACFKKF